jgi:hypothetical protein
MDFVLCRWWRGSTPVAESLVEMRKTFSEALFEAFCQERKIPCKRIVEGRQRSPDYELAFNAVRVIVEVKGDHAPRKGAGV